MSRAERRRRPPHSGLTPHFDHKGRLAGFSGYANGASVWLPRAFVWALSRAHVLALEVSNGVRWPWLDPRAVVRALRGPHSWGVCTGARFRHYRATRLAERWLAALELTPRERAELLAYLTRGAA